MATIKYIGFKGVPDDVDADGVVNQVTETISEVLAAFVGQKLKDEIPPANGAEGYRVVSVTIEDVTPAA